MYQNCPRKTILSSKPKSVPTNKSIAYNPRRSWNTRNNSSNVSSLLAPCSVCDCDEDDEDLPRKLTLFSKCEKPGDFHRTTYKQCYCTKKPIKPKLNCGGEPIYQTGRDLKIVKPYNQSTDSILLKHNPAKCKRKSFLSDNLPCVKKCMDDSGLNESLLCNNGRKNCLRQGSGGSRKSSSDVHSLTNKRSHIEFDCPCDASDLGELQDFRDNNYFDCHSHTNLTKAQNCADHKCVHKFTLNDRLLPMPDNPDQYGISHCCLCDKPIKSQSGIKTDVTLSTNTLNRATRSMLRPDKIVVNGEETMEVNIPDNVLKETDSFQKFISAYSKYIPMNSCALRHQRGVYTNH